MTQYSYTPQYITRDDEPWFPIMGEMHFSRYPKKYWKESLYKMKAGGVDIVSSYVIWIHHEEAEGEYDFTDQRDLRAFAQACKECNIKFFIRIGPWAHAEVRNGGLPDWIFDKGFEPRTNSEDYFTEVKKFYSEIYKQVEGLLHKDGGPIIGAQIENEYGHVGGLRGEEGEAHMKRLAQIAKDVGFDLPIYTATGWGGAVTGGLLPVMGGYCEAPWDPRTTEIEPSVNYVFTHERNDHGIACDHGVGASITFDPKDFPYLTAELGGGLQVTHHRRCVAEPKDIGAMSLVKLGSGVTLLGYYMYHGGTNPKGKLSTLQESKETGYPNDLPEFSYDFRASIREFGQMSGTLKELKLLAMFIADFGSEICLMPAHISKDNPENPEDLTSLRYSLRHDGKKGYIFVNNYQRHYKMAEHKGVSLKAKLDKETIEFPEIDIKDGDFFFYPFNMQVSNATLKSALATPLCVIDGTHVFYTDDDPKYSFEGTLEKMPITITRKEALNAWKVSLDKDYLVISENPVIENEQGYEMLVHRDSKIKVFPKPEDDFKGFDRLPDDGEFAVFKCAATIPQISAEYKLILQEDDKKRYQISLSGDLNVDDCFVGIDYAGDKAQAFINGQVATDDFNAAETWEIGLKRFDMPKDIEILIYPLYKDDKIYLQKWPEMKDGKACELLSVNVRPEVKVPFAF